MTPFHISVGRDPYYIDHISFNIKIEVCKNRALYSSQNYSVIKIIDVQLVPLHFSFTKN